LKVCDESSGADLAASGFAYQRSGSADVASGISTGRRLRRRRQTNAQRGRPLISGNGRINTHPGSR
jgi:hypothetical protein